ncbi:MAG: right-handed parallel beta-helix repeat-containing protein [Thermoplasmatota archaeon]
MMKKLIEMKPIIMGFALITTSFIFVGLMTDEVSAVTHVVDNLNGPIYTINEAIAASGPGDSIMVNYGTGTYNENNPLTINMPLTIIGQMNQDNEIPTISANNANNNVISILSGCPVVVENFVITGATGASGVYSQVAAHSGSEVLIQNCEITENMNGVTFTQDSAYNVIDDCEIHLNSIYGVEYEGTNHLIDDCGSTFTVDSGIYSNGYGGIHSTYLFYSGIEDSNIYNNGMDGIDLSNANSNNIKNVEIWNNDYKGLSVVGDSNTMDGMTSREIKDNNGAATGTARDVFINGYSNTLKGYTIKRSNTGNSNDIGVETYNANSNNANIVRNCQVYNYDGDDSIGLKIDGGDEVRGSSTKVHDNEIGIQLGSGLVNSILDCDNTLAGTGSHNIYDNQIGVYVDCKGAIIRETYFYYTGIYGANNLVGIRIDNNNNYQSDADIDDCKFEKLETGIKISDSDSNYYSTVDECGFESIPSYGIYIENGGYDQITSSSITNCDAGIYLKGDTTHTVDHVDIYGCTFSNTVSTGGSMYTGVYGYRSNYNTIESCTFDGYNKGVWFKRYSTENTIEDCEFSDDSDVWEATGWGQNNADIGVLVEYQSNGLLIDTCDFDEQTFAMGILGTQYISIDGDDTSGSSITMQGP